MNSRFAMGALSVLLAVSLACCGSRSARADGSHTLSTVISETSALPGKTTEQVTVNASAGIAGTDYSISMTITGHGKALANEQFTGLRLGPEKPVTKTFRWPVPSGSEFGLYQVTVKLLHGDALVAGTQNGFSVVGTHVLHGACGRANGLVTRVAPSTELCGAGKPSAVRGTGSWLWSCLGAEGGRDASCMASPPLEVCETIPGTSIQVGAACLPRSGYPALANAQDPVSFGADPTGNKDSTLAFQNAVNAGDLHIRTPGTYLINSGRGVWVPSHRAIQCAPGVTLLTTRHGADYSSGIFYLLHVRKVSIAGCDFQGANKVAGPKPLDTKESDFLILAQDSASILIEGNTFANTFANSAVQFYSASTPGVTDSKIQYNTFSGVPLYAIAVAAGSDNLIQNNLSIDGDIGVEADNTSQAMGNITIKDNEIRVLHGNCAKNPATTLYCVPQLMITGGEAPKGMDYSKNVVSNNFCAGSSVQPAIIYNDAPENGRAAQYSKNILGPNCTCSTGTDC